METTWTNESGKTNAIEGLDSYYGKIFRNGLDPLSYSTTEESSKIDSVASKLRVDGETRVVVGTLYGSFKSGSLRQLKDQEQNNLVAASLFVGAKFEAHRRLDWAILRTMSESCNAAGAIEEYAKKLTSAMHTKFVRGVNVDGVEYAKRHVEVIIYNLGANITLRAQLREAHVAEKARHLLDAARAKGELFRDGTMISAAKAVVIAAENCRIRLDHAKISNMVKMHSDMFEVELRRFRNMVGANSSHPAKKIDSAFQ